MFTVLNSYEKIQAVELLSSFFVFRVLREMNYSVLNSGRTLNSKLCTSMHGATVGSKFEQRMISSGSYIVYEFDNEPPNLRAKATKRLVQESTQEQCQSNLLALTPIAETQGSEDPLWHGRAYLLQLILTLCCFPHLF